MFSGVQNRARACQLGDRNGLHMPQQKDGKDSEIRTFVITESLSYGNYWPAPQLKEIFGAQLLAVAETLLSPIW